MQREGGPIEEIRPEDLVWFPPGDKHWHGAMPTTAMTHIAVQEALDGKAVEWLEHVTDEQCGAGTGALPPDTSGELRSGAPPLRVEASDNPETMPYKRLDLSIL